MGLVVGIFLPQQGWLAALLCCCAAVNEDEDPVVKRMETSKGGRSTVVDVCNEQPAPVKAMILQVPRPMTAVHSFHNEAGFNFHERQIADRPPSLEPLDFGEPSPLFGRIDLPVRHTSSHSVAKRMSIGTPTGFRRRDHTEAQRRSLIPLQLEPVTLRRSVAETGTKDMEPGQSSSSSMRSMRRQAWETRSSTSISSTSIEWGRLNRKRDSNRKSISESTESDVEQEILELNTIVEEIRLESSRSRSSEGHVSAVAPLMSIRARSELLSDIGSAFSHQKGYQSGSQSACEADSDSGAQSVSPMENRLSRPFTEMPDLSAVFPGPEPKQSQSDSRIGNWLSNILGSNSNAVRRIREDLYSSRPQHGGAVSEASTLASGRESPTFTIASQSDGSRALTAESGMTPASIHMAHGSTKRAPAEGESPSRAVIHGAVMI